MRADVARSDALLGVAPDKGADDVEGAKDDAKDARGENELGKVKRKGIRVVALPVQRAQDVAADDDDGGPHPGDAVRVGQNWPRVAVKVADEFDDRKLGYDEEKAAHGREE